MNIVLFEAEELETPLSRKDERAIHVLEVLRRGEGERFDAGVINGKRGKGIVSEIGEDALRLSFVWNAEEEPLLYPVDLIVGLSRPQTNRKLLQEATAMGARSIRFITTDKGEPSYASSKLWTTGEWRRHVIAGATQAFTTRLPEITYGMDMATALSELGENVRKIALDNYEGERALSEIGPSEGPVALILGSERGWSAQERDRLRKSGCNLAHLGNRPLRSETAAIAGLSWLLGPHWR